MLVIKDLKVKVSDTDKVILDNFNLSINEGEVHVIMGPNGTGKSTLAKTILGHYKFEVECGDIEFYGKRLNDLSTDERAKLGIFLAMQDPTEIEGVSNSEFLRTALGEVSGSKVNLYEFITSIEKAYDDVSLNKDMLHRFVNKGFSGGEKKKNEVLQLKMLKPKLIILDELDSGLDVDSLKIVCKNINNYLKENKKASVLIITHYPRILDYLKPDYVHIMKNGNIKQTGDLSLASFVEKNGYDGINAVEERDLNE